MTRDDATKIAYAAWFSSFPATDVPMALVSTLSALGILKLDEPKSEEAKRTETNWALAKAFRDWERDTGSRVDLLGYVEAAGLKVVEK